VRAALIARALAASGDIELAAKLAASDRARLLDLLCRAVAAALAMAERFRLGSLARASRAAWVAWLRSSSVRSAHRATFAAWAALVRLALRCLTVVRGLFGMVQT